MADSSWHPREIAERRGGESVQLWNKRRLQAHADWETGKAFYMGDFSDVSLYI